MVFCPTAPSLVLIKETLNISMNNFINFQNKRLHNDYECVDLKCLFIRNKLLPLLKMKS